MKKLLFLSVAFLSIIIFSSSFKKSGFGNYHHPLRSGGAAGSGNANRTGAPFGNGTCANCHGGGTFAPTFDVQLLNSANNTVTNYTPSTNYTLRISIVATSGTPQYGFQTTSVKSSDNTNLNTWGASLPPGVVNWFLTTSSNMSSNNRNYLEHNSLLNSGIINIPWTAPAANFGAVKFYTAGNAVDGGGGTGGDNATPANVLTIGETVLPITLSAFTARQSNTTVILTWKTAQEINNDYFSIENSTDNITFKVVGKINAAGNSTNENNYSFEDKNAAFGKNFYRLAQVDFSGKINYSSIVEINYSNVIDNIKISPNPVSSKIFLKSSFNLIGSFYTIVNSAGSTMLTGNFLSNEINVENLPKGNYYIKVKQKNNKIITQQFVK